MVAFRCYNGSRVGRGHADAWRAAVPSEFNAEVDFTLELLQNHHKTSTDRRYFKELRGKCEGLTEIRIDFELEPDDPRTPHEALLPHASKRRRPKRPKVVIRILGTGTADDFVLLYGFRKHGEPEYGPACHSALNRKAGVARDERRARPCRFP